MNITAFRSFRTPATNTGDAPTAARADAMGPSIVRAVLFLVALGGWLLIGAFALPGAGALELASWGVTLLSLGYAVAARARLEAVQRTRLHLLAETVADSERKKISLDLHDSAIQPYLGLRLGLEALRRKAAPDNPLARDIDELYRVTQDSVAELRGYVRVLGGDPRQCAIALAEGLRRQIDRFRTLYGLDVDVDLSPDVKPNDRLAAEIVRMVGEALSNAGRHTAARKVAVSLTGATNGVVVQIADDGHRRGAWRPFTPVSLARRAQRLGGKVEVAPQANGGTMVRITLPHQ